MMLALILRNFKDRRTSWIVYSLSGVLLLWMYVALFPTFSEQAASMDEFIKSFPEGFMKAFGIEDFDLSTIEKFLSTEQYSFVWPLLTLFFLVSMAGSSLAGEIERGTSEMLLARPVSRNTLYWSRYLSSAAMFVVFLAFTVLAVIPLSELHGVEYVIKSHLILAGTAFLFGLAVLSIAMMLSALFSERSKVYMITGGVLVAMYVLNIVSVLKESLVNVKYLSFFYYFDPGDALVRQEVSPEGFWVFLGVIIVCSMAGSIFFSRRDIKSV
ncbi:MAG: ABC transporter permease subunit [bacterium]|nr:ABC transporter permease subunit [bacterium]